MKKLKKKFRPESTPRLNKKSGLLNSTAAEHVVFKCRNPECPVTSHERKKCHGKRMQPVDTIKPTEH